MLAKTRAMGVTMTSYLAAAQMLAAYQEMPALERGKVISVSLPVNLRSYYGTETARNFFNSIRISWVFRGDETLETLAKGFDAKLREALKDERVKARMDGFEKLEQMPGIKLVPLFIKNAVVNLFNTLEAKKSYPDHLQHGAHPTAKRAAALYQRLYGVLQFAYRVHHGLFLWG